MPTNTTLLKPHRKLTAKQNRLLLITDKFRFITPTLYAAYENKTSRTSMHATLERLVQSGYLAKRLLSNVDFNNKGGRYYLTPKGFRCVQTSAGISENLISFVYKSKSLSEAYIDQYTLTMKVYIALRKTLGEGTNMFAKTEIAPFEEMPRPLPELYIRTEHEIPGFDRESFVLLCTEMPLFLIKKRFNQLVEHAEAEDWDSAETPYYPALMFVVSEDTTEKRVHRFIDATLNNMGLEDDLIVRTTTLERLLHGNYEARVWQKSTTEENR